MEHYQHLGNVEYGKEVSIDVDSCTVMGIDLAEDPTDYTCVVVVRKVGGKIEVVDTHHQYGNDTGEMLDELMARYDLKVQNRNGGWDVFRT